MLCRQIKLGVLLFCALGVVAVLPRPARGAEARVVIITPHTEAIRTEFARGFTRWHETKFHAPAKVDWRDVGGTSDALKFVQSEFKSKPDGIGIDCFFGGGLEPFLVLSEKKFSQRYEPPREIMEGIPRSVNGIEIYDRNYTWFGAVLSSFGILQNTRLERMLNLPLAVRWEDLADPRLRGWVGAGDPRNSGTMNVMFESFLQAYGWERAWQVLTEIGGNVRKFDRISSSTAKDVTLGETAYGFAIDFYALSQVGTAGKTNVTFVLPQDFTAMNPDGLCVLKGAPNLEVAQRFVDFVLSEEGQKIWFFQRGQTGGPQHFSIDRMSVRPDFYKRFRSESNIEFSPFDLKQKFVYDSKLGGQRREVVAALVGALLVDTHSELQSAWRAVIQRSLRAGDVKALGQMPITEAQALELAKTDWKKPAIRNQKKIEWQRWAMEKYRRIQQP